MQEKLLRNAPLNSLWCHALVITLASVAISTSASAQNISTAAPSGASGMTTGSSSTTGSQMKLMQIRAQAYQAKKDTEAASLARSTDRALEERNLSSAVTKSRQIKQIKQNAARKMEFEKSSQAYNKVSSNDISRWTDQRGNVKVQRDAPVFNNPLGEPPADAVNPPTLDRTDSSPLEEEERSGFSPFKGAGNAVKKIGGMNPFKKKDEKIGLRVPEVDLNAPAKEENKGFLSGLTFIGKKDNVQQNLLVSPEPVAPVEKEKKGFLKGIGQNLPLIGKKNRNDNIYAPSAPVQPTAPIQQPVATTAPPSPVKVQGSTMVDGIAKVPNANNTVSPVAPANIDSVATTPTASNSNTDVNMPPVEEKPGFMGRLRNVGDKINPFSKNDAEPVGGEIATAPNIAVEEEKTSFMSKFNKKDDASQPTATAPAAVATADKPGLMDRFRGIGGTSAQGNRVGGNGTIDASLFPDGSTSATPMGGPLTAAAPAAPNTTAAGRSGPTGEFAAAPSSDLPGQEKKGLQFPTLTVPDFSEVGKPDPTVPKKWKERTTSHKGGSNYYVVSAATNFMKFGRSQFNSEVSELAPGTVVRMTKPGDEWSLIQLQNGSNGIVKNKSLRPAQAAEVPSGFGTATAPASISAN